MSDTVDFLTDFWSFNEERVYLLIAIARSKENAEVAATNQPTMRKVVEDVDEIEDKLEQLEHATSRFEQQYRLYATVNARNVRDALHFLLKESLDSIREGEKSGDVARLLKRVDHEWKSILHQPRCRDDKYFLWDVDDASPEARTSIQQTLEEHTERVLTAETPNGWHIVTEPFNFTEIGDFDSGKGTFHGYECERKPDDMVFVGFLNQ